MRKLIASTLALAAMAMFALPQGARAQTASASCPDDGSSCSATTTQTASIIIPRVLYIDVGNTDIKFPKATAGDFNANYATTTDATTISSAGNVGYIVTVVEGGDGDSEWEFTDTGTTATTNPGKSAEDLQYSTDGGGSFTALPLGSNGAVKLYSKSAGEHDNAETLNWRVALDYGTDVPGGYTLDVDFTIVAN